MAPAGTLHFHAKPFTFSQKYGKISTEWRDVYAFALSGLRRAFGFGEKVYVCPQGHSFDVARQGYCNLLPVTKKHSKSPGDTKEQVQARRAFLSGGFYRPIADMLCRLAVPLKPNTVVDAGCGEGYYLNTLREALPQADLLGLDISKEAVRCAAGRYK